MEQCTLAVYQGLSNRGDVQKNIQVIKETVEKIKADVVRSDFCAFAFVFLTSKYKILIVFIIRLYFLNYFFVDMILDMKI